MPHLFGPRKTKTSTGPGFFRLTFEAMMGARERQARHEMTMCLLSLDDQSLQQLGYSRVELMAEGPQSPF